MFWKIFESSQTWRFSPIRRDFACVVKKEICICKLKYRNGTKLAMKHAKCYLKGSRYRARCGKLKCFLRYSSSKNWTSLPPRLGEGACWVGPFCWPAPAAFEAAGSRGTRQMRGRLPPAPPVIPLGWLQQQLQNKFQINVRQLPLFDISNGKYNLYRYVTCKHTHTRICIYIHIYIFIKELVSKSV